MITVNKETLCKAFKKGWKITPLFPGDFPKELEVLIDLVNLVLSKSKRLEDLDTDLLEIISSQENLFVIEYEQDLLEVANLFTKLLKKGYTTEELDILINDAKSESPL